MMETSAQDQYVEKYLDFAAAGDVEKLTHCLKVMSNIDIRNEKGWTALMFAARNGHAEIVKLLIDRGCDVNMINNSGHTAADITKFWNHDEISNLFEVSNEPGEQSDESFPTLKTKQKVNYFCSTLLDRAAHRRKDKDWLETKMKDRRTKFLIFTDLQPLVVPYPDNNTRTRSREQLRLLDATCDEIQDILEQKPLLVFLGVEEKIIGERREEIAWFTIHLEGLSDERISKIHPHGQILTPFPGAMQLTEKEAGILSQARTMLAWHDRYQFCPTCGADTTVEDAGYKRTCVKDDCKSRAGVHNTSYPRTDPTVIMAVVSPDRKQLLLGRGKKFPRPMFSCLAGFMEPGESIEDAVRREVHEESGIKIGHVEYHSCQPWPMPASLMIGCIAYATTTDIVLDPEELADAKWFDRQDVVQMLTHQHPKGIFCPPEQAIAHQLIRTWVARSSNL